MNPDDAPSTAIEPAAVTEATHTTAPMEASCPPPLQWQEVLREVQQQSNHWTVERPGTTLSGMSLGDGPPLVFLNTLSEPREVWFLLAWLLRDQYRCVLFDWRGIRTPNSAQVTLDLLVEDLLAIVDHWPGQSNRLIATRFGGMVALGAMAQRPSQFLNLTWMGGYAQRELSPTERLLVALGKVWPFRASTLPGRRSILRQNHRRWFPPFDETRYDFLSDLTGQVPVMGLARLASVVGQADLRPLLPTISQPVLLVGTEGQGAALRAAGDALAAALPNVRREEMHNTGLIPALTHPHRVAKIVRSFLDGLTMTPTTG